LARRREEVEDIQEYLHKLGPDEMAWMNQFMKEYNDADLTNSEFHNTKEDRKICFDRNNARNRCDYTLAKAENKLNLLEFEYELEQAIYEHTDHESEEDFLEPEQ